MSVLRNVDSLCPPWILSPALSFDYECLNSFLDLPFSSVELDAILAGVNLKSSPELDNVDYLILKNLPPLDKAALFNLYNAIFLRDVFPADWRRYLVFFIPKSVLSSDRFPWHPAYRNMEKLVVNRLNWWLEFYRKLPNFQFGFRK